MFYSRGWNNFNLTKIWRNFQRSDTCCQFFFLKSFSALLIFFSRNPPEAECVEGWSSFLSIISPAATACNEIWCMLPILFSSFPNSDFEPKNFGPLSENLAARLRLWDMNPLSVPRQACIVQSHTTSRRTASLAKTMKRAS